MLDIGKRGWWSQSDGHLSLDWTVCLGPAKSCIFSWLTNVVVAGDFTMDPHLRGDTSWDIKWWLVVGLCRRCVVDV